MRKGALSAALVFTAATSLAAPAIAGASPATFDPINTLATKTSHTATGLTDAEFHQAREGRVHPQAEKTLEIDYQIQETGYWCGPAAGRIALSASTDQLPSQGQLAEEMGTTENGTDDISQISAVLNSHLGEEVYQNTYMPDDPPSQGQKDQLWNDIVGNVDNGLPVVTNIVAPPGNQPPGYPPDQTIYHYFTVTGYNDEHGTVQIADSANFGGNQIYWLSFEQLASLVPPKGYAA